MKQESRWYDGEVWIDSLGNRETSEQLSRRMMVEQNERYEKRQKLWDGVFLGVCVAAHLAVTVAVVVEAIKGERA